MKICNLDFDLCYSSPEGYFYKELVKTQMKCHIKAYRQGLRCFLRYNQSSGTEKVHEYDQEIPQ